MTADAGPATSSAPTGVPPPPKPFPSDINLVETAAGLEMHRVHSAAFAGNVFNPSAVKRNRFSPIRDSAGQVVPVLYAGATAACAFYETLFHDKAVAGALSHLNTSHLAGRLYGTYVLERKLKLAALFAPDLARLNVTLDQLTHSSSGNYVETARWAEAIHHEYPKVDGLVWTSYRGDPDSAYVLFGDRVPSSALQPKSAGQEILTNPSLLELLLDCAQRLGVRVHLSGVAVPA